MRLLLAILITFGLSVSAVADETFPYEATIASESANIRSGPADVHYVTNQLSRGDKVEVFRHDPGGWCAIRPPQSEFSLVRAKYILLNSKNGTGRVTLDGTRAWVGTRVAAQSEPMWQIQLQRGDIVKVIGKQQVQDANGALNTWYEIAPPSGEFRWVHEREFKNPEFALQKAEETGEQVLADKASGPVETLAVEILSGKSPPRSISPQVKLAEGQSAPASAVAIRPQPFQPTRIDFDSTASRLQPPVAAADAATTNLLALNDSRPANGNKTAGGWQIAGDERTTGPRQFADREAPPTKLAVAIETSSNGTGNLPISVAENDAISENADQLKQTQGESFEDQYRQLELLLTKSILKPADQWRLEPLQRVVEEFAKEAIDPDQQIMVNALLGKIRSFEELQQQHRAVNAAPANPGEFRKSGAAKLNALQDESIVRQEANAQAIALPIDRGVRPAAFAENSADRNNQDRPVDRGAAETAAESKEADDSTDASGAVGSGVAAEPDSIYDGTGWLNVLYTNNGKGRSGYVLQDENGNIIKTILPAPGLNLDRYLKQEVGVMGRRGFNRKYNLPHVTADRVILLERHR